MNDEEIKYLKKISIMETEEDALEFERLVEKMLAEKKDSVLYDLFLAFNDNCQFP